MIRVKLEDSYVESLDGRDSDGKVLTLQLGRLVLLLSLTAIRA